MIDCSVIHHLWTAVSANIAPADIGIFSNLLHRDLSRGAELPNNDKENKTPASGGRWEARSVALVGGDTQERRDVIHISTRNNAMMSVPMIKACATRSGAVMKLD